MDVPGQVEAYLASQPEPKQADLRRMHAHILAEFPGCRLWFTDGTNADGKGKQVLRRAPEGNAHPMRLGTENRRQTLSAAWPDVQSLARARKLAILMAMSPAEQMSLADVKNRLSEVVDRLEREHGRVVITKHGHPAAVVISLDDLESLEETLDVMDSAPLLADIRESLAELGAGDVPVLTRDEALSLIADR
jgi:antitoxin YefM